MPFRDSYFTCYCGAELGIRKSRAYSVRECLRCGGSWVPVQDLQNMLQMMEPSHQRARELAELWVQIGDSKRACIECGKAMRLALIEQEQVDICTDHGVWFDRPELSAVLQKYADPDA